MEEPGFWDDPEKAQKQNKELSDLNSVIDGFKELENAYEDIETLLEMGYEENDASLIPEIEEELNTFIEKFDKLRIQTLLSGEYDKDNAILTLHAGAVTGQACCAVCISDGRTKKDFSVPCWIFWMVRKLA